MFLTLKIEKISKKLRSKTVKNYVFLFFFFLFCCFSFEIINLTGKLHKDFRTLFVFKHRRKTKKFTLKWQIPLFEKRVLRLSVYDLDSDSVDSKLESQTFLGVAECSLGEVVSKQRR